MSEDKSQYPLCANCFEHQPRIGICVICGQTACENCGETLRKDRVVHKSGWCLAEPIPHRRQGTNSDLEANS